MGGEFRILKPCTRDRDSLDGQGAVRWCPDCRKNVYDFSLLTGREIQRLTAAGTICGIIQPPRLARRRFLRWASVLAVFPLRFASAQGSDGSVSGVVVDSMGGLIPGARVQILSAAGGEPMVASSNDRGRFLIENAPRGEAKVTVEQMGFSRFEQKVKIGNSRLDLHEIVLELGLTGEVVQVGRLRRWWNRLTP